METLYCVYEIKTIEMILLQKITWICYSYTVLYQ